MIIKKKFMTVAALTVLVVAGIAAVDKPGSIHKNLKILPNDISEQKLDSIMQSYSKALGVSCGFCHKAVQGFTDSLDYASDNHEMKANARKMMRMTIEINRTNFYFDTTQRPEYLKVVHCKTCHRGEPYPVD